MPTASPNPLRKMTTDFPTASLGSSQAPTDAMEKSPPPQTQKSGHPRLIAFGRLPAIQRAQRGLPRPRTFAFLGFTNYCGWTRDGRFIVKHKTQSTRLTRKLNELRQDAWRRMHDPSGRPAPLVRQRAAGPLRVLRHAAQLAGACRLRGDESGFSVCAGAVIARAEQGGTGSTR